MTFEVTLNKISNISLILFPHSENWLALPPKQLTQAWKNQ